MILTHLQHVKRPSTIDLLAYDRISVAAKEREMTQLHLDLKKREDELSKEKDNLRIREESLMEREHELILRERNVTLRERALRDQGSVCYAVCPYVTL